MENVKISNVDLKEYSSIEAMNTICSNLLFAGTEYKNILLTSSFTGDGKSFLAMRILMNLAQRGKRVLLIDADLRKSALNRDYSFRFSESNGGLSHYLAGMSELNEVIYETNIPNAYIIPVGKHVSNSVTLIGNERFQSMLIALDGMFDMVLIDAPPIGQVVDAAIMAKNCDGVVFVVNYNKTTREELFDMKRQMQKSGCKILGCIINKVAFEDISSKKYYNKGYYQTYTSDYYSYKRKQGRMKNAD